MWFFDKKLCTWQNHWDDWESICTSSVYHHQSRRLGHHGKGKGMCRRSSRTTSTTLRRSRWTRKMTNLDEFMHYDDWLRAIKKLFKVSFNVTRRTWLFLFLLPFLLHGLYSLRGWGNRGKNKWGKAEGPWEHRTKMERNKGTRTLLRYTHWASLSPSYRTTDIKYRD